MSPFVRFLAVMGAIDLVGVLAAAFTTDATLRWYVVVATLLVSPVIAFVAVYGVDRAAFRDAFGRR
ncbi:MAG: hypothetical protein ACQETB_00330 [Halobacteriota archaeon]